MRIISKLLERNMIDTEENIFDFLLHNGESISQNIFTLVS
jgi:hypothetical protein